jgi:hypothetical protein
VTYQGRRRAKRVGDRKAAEAVGSQLRARLALGDQSPIENLSTRPTTPGILFEQLAADWLVWYPGVHAIRKTTLENHESFLRAHLLPFFGATPVARITPDLVEDFIAAKRATGGAIRRGGQGLADSSLKVGLGTLRLILGRAVRRKLLPANPVDQADWRATPRVDTRIGSVTFVPGLEGGAMSHNLMESIVRGRLQQKRGQVYCHDCLANDLQQDPQVVKAAMDTLAGLSIFKVRACPCGKGGLMYLGRGSMA